MNERDKLDEAQYFYGQMLDSLSDVRVFRYNFSAFLTAARSAMQYALCEATKAGHQDWYDDQVATSLILKFFKSLRDANIHVKPPGLCKSVTVHAAGAVAFAGHLTMQHLDPEGNPVGRPASANGQAPIRLEPKPAQVEHGYTLQEWSGKEDLPSLCRAYLDEVTRFVEAGIAKGYITG